MSKDKNELKTEPVKKQVSIIERVGNKNPKASISDESAMNDMRNNGKKTTEEIDDIIKT